ncbi:MAG: SpoIID/LytB domain-containing protein [Eubacteriales bacterium]|nr:SpoIID/LytB domain-containing protein [Eubacteriales bacterium]
MKKISLFIMSFFMLFSFSAVNISAHEHTSYIKVGLAKSKNVDNIHIDNLDALVGYGNGFEFIQKANISSNYGFDIKPLGNYYVKLSNSFSTYDEALNFSNDKLNMFPMLENDSWKVYINGFNTVLEAQNYIKENNNLGELVNLQNVIGVYIKDKLLMGYYGTSPFQLKNNSNRLSINGKLYRNVIQINIIDKKLSAINVLDIDEYLYGVVPSEMPASWHIEALKAQAVAARNYAHSNLGLHSSEGFDVCDTVHCQVYNGITSESNSTNKAIDETKGIFAYYKGELINAVYSSSNGGYSENSENVWDNKLEYLRAIKDDNEEGGKVWERSFTFDELTNLAGNIGNINEVILENSDTTGRVISLTLFGDSGQKVLKNEEIIKYFSN